MADSGWWFVAFGSPAPQGSKSFKGMTKAGRAILAESSRAVKPWRQDVMAAAIEAKQAGAECLSGPLAVTMVFTLPRPKNAPRRWVAPGTRPDLSKLVRSTEDAITVAGLWSDDGQVHRMNAVKVWAGYDLAALPSCGVRVACTVHGPEDDHEHLVNLCLDAYPAPDLVDMARRPARRTA